MKNKSFQNCRFVHHVKFHCIMTTLNRLFKIELERGGTGKEPGGKGKRAEPAYLQKFALWQGKETYFVKSKSIWRGKGIQVEKYLVICVWHPRMQNKTIENVSYTRQK